MEICRNVYNSDATRMGRMKDGRYAVSVISFSTHVRTTLIVAKKKKCKTFLFALPTSLADDTN